MKPHFAGYATPMIAAPGGRIAFRFSALPARTVRGRLVRIACANPEGDGPPESLVDTGLFSPGAIELGPQPTRAGSRLEADLPVPLTLDVFTIGCAVMPTRTVADMTILAMGAGASRLALVRRADGRGQIEIGGVVLTSEMMLPERRWTAFSISFDLTAGALVLRWRRLDPGLPADRHGPTKIAHLRLPRTLAPLAVATLCFACDPVPGGRPFDGRIDLPTAVQGGRDLLPTLLDIGADGRLGADPDLLWAFRFRAATPVQHDLGPLGIAAQSVHHPQAGVKGARWTGDSHDRRLVPGEYSALHFNSDAVTDAGWAETGAVELPGDLPSGIYAFLAEDGEGARAFATFFVSTAGRARHRLAFLAPTLTYQAYGNAPETSRGVPSARGLLPGEVQLNAVDGAFGRSIYDKFHDGFGVTVAGLNKPILNMAPDARLWGLPTDTLLLHQLEQDGLPFDLVTDHDLHRDGSSCLAGIDVLVTGSHPEYWSTRMWNALSEWLTRGGRLLYLGGNGFYWRTAVAADGTIEVRRAEDGTRPFIGEPAEYVHGLNDEAGGLWRRLGRPPQALVGVGMAAQGFSRSTHYRKLPDAATADLAFVFDGVAGDRFGYGGLCGGGASGLEIDRHDVTLGSDPAAWLLATSEDHAEDMVRTKEEWLSAVIPRRDRKARSDMVLTVLPGGGAVFAVGSIAWIGAVADGCGDGSIGRVTCNVIRRFLDPAPLPRKSD